MVPLLIAIAVGICVIVVIFLTVRDLAIAKRCRNHFKTPQGKPKTEKIEDEETGGA